MLLAQQVFWLSPLLHLELFIFTQAISLPWHLALPSFLIASFLKLSLQFTRMWQVTDSVYPRSNRWLHADLPYGVFLVLVELANPPTLWFLGRRLISFYQLG